MIVTRLSADRWICSAYSRCSEASGVSSSRLTVADHAVHRRADLVADGGQEGALGLGRLERRVTRGGELPLHLAAPLDLLAQVVVDAPRRLRPASALVDEVGADAGEHRQQQADAEHDLRQRRIGGDQPAAAPPRPQPPVGRPRLADRRPRQRPPGRPLGTGPIERRRSVRDLDAGAPHRRDRGEQVVVQHEADRDPFVGRRHRRRHQDQEAVALDVDVHRPGDDHGVGRPRLLDQRPPGSEALQIDRLAPAGIRAGDDAHLERRRHPGDRGEPRQGGHLAVRASGPVGGVGHRPVGETLHHACVQVDGATDVAGERDHVAMLHRQGAARALHRQRSPEHARQRGEGDRHRERDLPPAGDRRAEERGAAPHEQQRPAERDGAGGDGHRHAGERIPRQAAAADEAGQARQPAGEQHGGDERARGVAQPRRAAAEGDEQPDAADHQDLRRGVVDPAVAGHQVPEHQPRSGRHDRGQVDQRADQGDQQDEQAGEAGPGLTAARQADDAGGTEDERRSGGDGAGAEQREAGALQGHRAERDPEPGRGGGSREEPRPRHRRPERPSSPHVSAAPFAPRARLDGAFPALNGSALSARSLNGGAGRRSPLAALLHWRPCPRCQTVTSCASPSSPGWPCPPRSGPGSAAS